MFFQDAPVLPNVFEADVHLQAELARRLSPSRYAEWRPRLSALGAAVAGPIRLLGDRAERELPEHVPYDPWGHRIDEIRVSDAWTTLQELSVQHRLVATGYDESLGAERRVLQTALLYLYGMTSATYLCPLAMTDAAARVLQVSAPRSLRDRLLPRLLATDPAQFITSGQWMTERTGGSDVSRSETVAKRVGMHGDEERFTLHGVKWFTSATTSEMSLALARIDGDDKLTLFCVELMREEGGGLQGIVVNRLKDKLGTRSVPTAELTLDGVVATRIGERGRGVATIADMLTITRYYNSVASASGMACGTMLAEDYSRRRQAFGRPIAEQPLHRATLADLRTGAAGALSQCLEIAELLGKAEAGTASDGERRRLRALVPLCKLFTGKQAVAHASETLECFGGAGYIEDTGLPRLLRNAQVLPIWEGTTNILSLDLLRAESSHQALTAVFDDLQQRLTGQSNELVESLKELRDLFAPAETREVRARRIALETGRLVQATLLLEAGAQAHVLR